VNKLRVLITDDSVVFRSQIKAALEGNPNIEVVGAASNGKIALDKLAQGNIDLMTLDMEMPEMNGLQTLREMKARGFKTKVIVFSSQTQKGADTALEALSLGAADVVAKPTGASSSLEAALNQVRSELLPKVLQFMNSAGSIDGARAENTPKPQFPTSVKPPQSINKISFDLLRPSVIVIGSSTGGPDALEKVFNGFSHPINCPILLAQHMPPIFTASLARRIGRMSNIEAKEPTQWEILSPNKIYVAPGDFHMTLIKQGEEIRIRLDQGPKRNSVRPAVDNLFETAAQIFGKQCAAFVLTGMGEDGLVGARAIKAAGGGVMIQDEKSCVVFGMPGAIYRAELYDKVGDLASVKSTMEKLAKASTFSQLNKAA
jgi:two-component system, chemotaxis family, protein-glutamate methylesterase/glutaminase